ncbi:hypothetical protein MKW92_006191 [Papaver armeniacum]|nr:hypothetical protein MKW92_006191 [Papaver armeniacum]
MLTSALCNACHTWSALQLWPAPGCCAGVKQIKAMTTTTEDRRQACGCVKDAANKYRNIKEDAASGLPAKCDAPLDYPISKNIDCST